MSGPVKIIGYETHGMYKARDRYSANALLKMFVSQRTCLETAQMPCSLSCFLSISVGRVIKAAFRNTECDYSSAYVSLFTNSDLVGYGMTFTIGRGNDIVCSYTASYLDILITSVG